MPPHKEATGPWENRPAEKPGLEFVTHKFDHDHHSGGARERESFGESKQISKPKSLGQRKKKRQGPSLISPMFFSL